MTVTREVNLRWEHVTYMVRKLAKTIREKHAAETPLKVYGVSRGGLFIQAMLGMIEGEVFQPVAFPDQADIIVDDIVDSGATRERYRRTYGRPFFALVEKKDKGEWVIFPWERTLKEFGPEENIRRILQYIGEDPSREGLIDTPRRVVSSWKELFSGYGQDEQSVLKVFENDGIDEMVVLRDIEFYSTCEHHLLPFFGRAHVGYLPKGKLVGVSKLARLVEIYSRRLQIQERLASQIADALWRMLQPAGVGVVLQAQHLCMTSRGVSKQNSVMVTSSMRGSFLGKNVKDEFYRVIGVFK